MGDDNQDTTAQRYQYSPWYDVVRCIRDFSTRAYLTQHRIVSPTQVQRPYANETAEYEND